MMYGRRKARDGLRGASPRATALPEESADGQAVYTGTAARRKEPTGAGKPVAHGKDVKGRERRTAETILNINKETGEPCAVKVASTVRRGAGEKAARTSLVAYPTPLSAAPEPQRSVFRRGQK